LHRFCKLKNRCNNFIISVKILAKILCCSSYEFQRLFSFIVGIPLSEYVMKRKLTLAGYDIQHRKDKIIDIAVRYCYESHSSFSRAFKEFHGITPSTARENKDVILKAYPQFTSTLAIGGFSKMECRIIELPATKMARSGENDIWEFGKWWPTIAEKDKSLLFPKDFWWNNEKTGHPEWLYAIPEGFTETNGYEVLDFPGGLYAVTTSYDEDEEKAKAYFALKSGLKKVIVLRWLMKAMTPTIIAVIEWVMYPHLRDLLSINSLCLYQLSTNKEAPISLLLGLLYLLIIL
jgi:AraC family transcriptional regulator